MSIIKYDPFRGFWGVSHLFDDIEEASYQKGLKVYEKDNQLVCEAVVAGVPAKDVDIEIEDGVVTIKGESKTEESSENKYQSSIYKYYYTTALSGGDWKKAEAEIVDGVVKIIIPKTKAVRPKKITVKTKGR